MDKPGIVNRSLETLYNDNVPLNWQFFAPHSIKNRSHVGFGRPDADCVLGRPVPMITQLRVYFYLLFVFPTSPTGSRESSAGEDNAVLYDAAEEKGALLPRHHRLLHHIVVLHFVSVFCCCIISFVKLHN